MEYVVEEEPLLIIIIPRTRNYTYSYARQIVAQRLVGYAGRMDRPELIDEERAYRDKVSMLNCWKVIYINAIKLYAEC